MPVEFSNKMKGVRIIVKKIKILISLLLICVFIMFSAVDNINATEKPADNLKITVENCNVYVAFSTNEQYSYDFDSSKFKITTTTKDSTFEIHISKVTDAEVNWNDNITIYIPNKAYNLMTATSQKGGLSLPPVDANIILTSDSGAVAINLPPNYTKTVDYTGVKSSGSLNLSGITNFDINAKLNTSAVSTPKAWPSLKNGNSSYNHLSGNGAAKININLTNCSFSFNE